LQVKWIYLKLMN